MSFQGDVRGIGLAELLQGLARGRKEGILTLTTSGCQPSVIGLMEGKAHLLPDPNEDAESWRTRARDAWVDGTRVDYLRMSEIARAQRLEDLYRLLDGGDVHFRFEPGVIPRPTANPGETVEQKTQVFCDAIQVEFLLLEYARIADELESSPQARALPRDMVPCVLDPSAVGGTPLQLLDHCDGRSTLQEVADRLGWSARQVQLSLCPALAAGGIRRAHPTELLHLALSELKAKHLARAVARLQAWCREALPGPLAPEEAELLGSEWLSGRLSAALSAMPARARRTLLRRLDHGLANPSQTVLHWLDVSRLDRTDRVARIKRMAAEFREGGDPDSPAVRDLLDWARDQRDAGHPWRAGPALVLAALRQPTNTTLQLELGTGLVAAGRAAEGAPWVLAGTRNLLEAGQADRAVSPLRLLLAKDPRNRECRQLLSRARRQSSQVRKLRKKLLIGLVGAGMLAGGALVKVRVDVGREGRLEEVRQALGTPQVALRLLHEHFDGDLSTRVLHLHEQIEQRQRLDEIEARSSWLAMYHDAQIEAAKGDPLAALGKIRAIAPPPRLLLLREPLPDSLGLYTTLIEHLGLELDALGEPVEGSPQQVAREDQIASWTQTLVSSVLADEPTAKSLVEFTERLREVQDSIDQRRKVRDLKIETRLASENLERQDQLYRKGEAYAKSGDLLRALNCWDECVALDQSGKVARLLEERMAKVRAQLQAIQDARHLAQEGRHGAAIALLVEHFDDPTDVILPWRVVSYPEGARVYQGEDRVWTTPFVIETTVGESVELTFKADGFLSRTLTYDQPADQVVHLERTPERAWQGRGRVDAIPVPVGADHIVVDRKGELSRIGPSGAVRWSSRIKTLSGLARAPVFLPERPGHLLLLTEDSDAWILNAADGDLEGPWQLGAAPRVGPAPSAGHVRARLADGRLVLWRSGLEPVLEELDPPIGAGAGEDAVYGADGGFAVARRRAGQEGSFPCPWRPWVVRAVEDAYVVHPVGRPREGYSILRHGEWAFLAWESASAGAPNGRLWVSDGAGVRSYVPLPDAP
jgi:tetratricopeptide (TPR) repeat protein